MYIKKFKDFILEHKEDYQRLVKDFNDLENFDTSYTNLVDELKDIENSSDFIEWNYELSGREGIKKGLSKEQLIGGYCEDLAVYLHYKYGAELYKVDDESIGDGHYFVKYKYKFYDAMNPEGVEKPSDFEWSQRLMQNNDKVTPDMIDSLLKTLGIEWSGYENSKHVIKPV